VKRFFLWTVAIIALSMSGLWIRSWVLVKQSQVPVPAIGTPLKQLVTVYGPPIEEHPCRISTESELRPEYGDFKSGCKRVLVFSTRAHDGSMIFGSWWTVIHYIALDPNDRATSCATELK
jgi:hypothetical protein